MFQHIHYAVIIETLLEVDNMVSFLVENTSKIMVMYRNLVLDATNRIAAMWLRSVVFSTICTVCTLEYLWKKYSQQ